MRTIVRSAGLKAEKRHRLVEAAIEEFNDYGLDNASYNRIIERSGLSKGSVYYYFDNKDALLGIVMEEIGERVLAAIPERPLPVSREEYWEVVWNYRQREFDFFASNVSLGRVLILSLGTFQPETGEVERVCPPLARLILRQKTLIRRGQELGAVRRDMSEDMIFELMRTLDRALCVRFFGHDAEDIERLSPEEKVERSRRYTLLFKDLVQRMLEPGILLKTREIKEESIDVKEIAVSA